LLATLSSRIEAKIGRKALISQRQDDRIRVIEGRLDQAAEDERETDQALWKTAKKVKEHVTKFHRDASTHWASRVLGHVIFSPPINVDVDNHKYADK
jgi:hypothetical protein